MQRKKTHSPHIFEWLEQEIAAVKTPKFHVVDGPANAGFREAVERSPLKVPPSYREFVLQFGNACLYRYPRNYAYHIGVYASPRQAFLNDDTCLFHLGFHERKSVYTKSSDDSIHGPIYEGDDDSEDKVANGFEEWLCVHSFDARNTFSAEEWQDILHGPRPFTAREKESIKARRAIRWRVLGIDAHDRHLIEIVNEGKFPLHTLTLGVRSRDRGFNGVIWLRISDIGPGQNGVVSADCDQGPIPPASLKYFHSRTLSPKTEDSIGSSMKASAIEMLWARFGEATRRPGRTKYRFFAKV